VDTQQNVPSYEEYQALYDAAGDLRAAEPWKVIYSGDVIGVRDPETGIIGYCCVTGLLDEYLAMHVYLGGSGIEAYKAFVDASDAYDGEPSPMDTMLAGRSITDIEVEFCNALELRPQDKARARDLGRSFVGRKAWPAFMRNDPCREPRDLDGWDARFLTVAIRQLLQVLGRINRDEIDFPDAFTQHQVLVRVPEDRGGTLVWHDAIEPLEKAVKSESLPLSESELSSLERLPVREFRLELAHTILPALVKATDSDRGMFIRIILAVDGRSGKVLGFHTFDEGEFPRNLLTQVAAMLKSTGFIPSQLLVNDPWVFSAIADGLPLLKSSLAVVKGMPASEDAVSAFAEVVSAGHS